MAKQPAIQPPIKHPVGRGGTNAGADVQAVAYLLNIIAQGPFKALEETGICSPDLMDRIRFVQSTLVGMPVPDANVGPKGRTLQAMGRAAAILVTPKKAAGMLPELPSPIIGAHRAVVETWLKPIELAVLANERLVTTLLAPGAGTNSAPSDADYQAAATAIGKDVEANMVKAFAQVESGPAGAFGSTGKPVIAYEGHWFRKYTDAAYDAQWPDLSYKYKKKAGPEWQRNNADQATAWTTLKSAATLDANAAMLACSWGRFQIMGFNFKACGYASVAAFVEAMKAGEKQQLDAFCAFCKGLSGFAKAMVDKDYVKLASSYNGADYGDYDKRIEKAYKKLSGTK